MSEIKGQLLGILLAALMFSVVGVAVHAIFTNLASSVTTKVDENIGKVETAMAPKEAYNPGALLEY